MKFLVKKDERERKEERVRQGREGGGERRRGEGGRRKGGRGKRTCKDSNFSKTEERAVIRLKFKLR